MAKVKIQGNASGSAVYTVQTSAGSVDKTITLPDATCTLADNSDVTNKLPLAGGTLTGALGGALELLRLDNTSASNYWSLKHWDGGTLDIESSGTDVLRLTSDGRGLSQFTAKAWAHFNGSGTPGFLDSHNFSSITDLNTGIWRLNFTNAMGNSYYSVAASAQGGHKTEPDGWTTSYIQLDNRNSSNANIDGSHIQCVIFGD
jgi:hypothetical protein